MWWNMTECEQIINDLPHHTSNYVDCQAGVKAPNAYVFVDEFGEVNIFPIDGGCIWSKKGTFVGDIAPWAD